MKRILLAILAGAVVGCSPHEQRPAPDAPTASAADGSEEGGFFLITVTPSDAPDDNVLWKDCFSQRKGVLYGHLLSAKTNAAVKAGEQVGTAASLPAIRSARFEQELRLSEVLYEDGRYDEAAAAVGQAAGSDASDPFILEAYARALYRVPGRREDSYSAYRHLVQTLDHVGASVNPDYVFVDLWFGEAYWKLASLYLDHGSYQPAICEIARSFYTHRMDQQAAVSEQALGYLAEAYFRLGNTDRAAFFARETIRRNPGNTSVTRYLEHPSR